MPPLPEKIPPWPPRHGRMTWDDYWDMRAKEKGFVGRRKRGESVEEGSGTGEVEMGKIDGEGEGIGRVEKREYWLCSLGGKYVFDSCK